MFAHRTRKPFYRKYMHTSERLSHVVFGNRWNNALCAPRGAGIVARRTLSGFQSTDNRARPGPRPQVSPTLKPGPAISRPTGHQSRPK